MEARRIGAGFCFASAFQSSGVLRAFQRRAVGVAVAALIEPGPCATAIDALRENGTPPSQRPSERLAAT